VAVVHKLREIEITVDVRRAVCRLLISWGKPNRSRMLSFVEISRRDKTKGWSHGSGWGVLYARKGTYGVYKSTSPIWESFVEPPDGYLLYLFHSRLASVGAVSLANTHPIIYGRYAIAHNGTIDKEVFGRELKQLGVDTRTGGSTDTELFLKAFVDLGGEVKHLRLLARLAAKHLDPEEPLLNMAIVNLETASAYLVTHRASEDPHFIPVKRQGDMLIASEPLDEGPWSPIPNDSLVILDEGGVKIERLW
jgi:predicted glutamine amidotransferase